MQLITTSGDLRSHFIRLLQEYPNYYFATAWAGIPTDVFDALYANRKRLKRFAVGIHFFQTDPKFFELFIGNSTVRAVLQPDGTFHPKIFLFYANDRKWSLLVGSSNFTAAAFTKNTEAGFVIDSKEADTGVLADAMQLIEDSWQKGKIIDRSFYEAYKLKWQIARVAARQLKSKLSPTDILHTGATEFMKLGWSKYVGEYSKVRDTVSRRYTMLESIRQIFSEKRSLMNMTEDERRLIAGNPNVLDLSGAENYADFGTSGNGQFMNKMIVGNEIISHSLDRIPLVGKITKRDFDAFLDIFLTEGDTSVGWVSSAGRLLAMKRPDTFYNVTNANRAAFCENFGSTASATKSLETYWESVVEKIQLSTWYDNSVPKGRFQQKLWDTRAAMQDVLFYTE